MPPLRVKPATLLLDTGGNNTILSPSAAGVGGVQLRALKATRAGTGPKGGFIVREADLRLRNRHWFNRRSWSWTCPPPASAREPGLMGFSDKTCCRSFRPCGLISRPARSNSSGCARKIKAPFRIKTRRELHKVLSGEYHPRQSSPSVVGYGLSADSVSWGGRMDDELLVAGQSALAEAKVFCGLAFRGAESVQEIRELIAVAPKIESILRLYMKQTPKDAWWIERALKFRRHVLEHFNRLVDNHVIVEKPLEEPGPDLPRGKPSQSLSPSP